ncbi:MAG: AI-2E family transporter [Pedosphaera sp.]|nr:AI-2E family transporter [Pedosphaera sp.]
MNLPPPTEKQARIIWLALTGLALALIVALVAATVWGLGRVLNVLSPVLWPIAVAGVLAYLLDPVVDFLQRRGVPRARGIAVVFVLALVIVTGLIASVVPRLVTEAQDLASKADTYTSQLRHRATGLAQEPPTWLPKAVVPLLRTLGEAAAPGTNVTSIVSTNLVSETSAVPATETVTAPAATAPADQASFKSITDSVARILPRFGQWLSRVFGFVGAVFGVIAGLALIPIYAFYFLLEKHGIESKWTDYLPIHESKLKEEVVFVLNSINDYLIAFFRGQVLVAICDGILYTIGFTIIGLPYSVLIGVMATFLTIIPFLGAITTCVTALLIALVSFGDWQHPVGVLAVFAVVQALEGLVIQPKIMGDRVGLHPVTIIIALMVGTTLLGGILGGILAIPLTAALRVVMFRYVWKKREV